MDLIDLLVKTGGEESIRQLAGNVGLESSQAQSLIGALAPALMRGLQKQTETSTSLAGLQRALSSGAHQQYLERPDLMNSTATRDDGNKILGHIFGSKDVSRNVAAHAARQTGIDSAIIKKALPLVAGLTMGALGKKAAGTASGSMPSRRGLGGLLGSLVAGQGGQQIGLDDLLGLAKKLF